MRFSLNSFLWTLPFVAFISGYMLVSLFSYKPIMPAPAVVGSNIADAVKVLSGHHLNARVLAEKEDTDLPDGIVVSQTPLAGQSIKAQQSVYLVVTKRPAKAIAPNFYGMNLADAKKLAQEDGIVLKVYAVESINPVNSCISQDIEPGQEVPEREIAVYVSKGTTSIRIMPSFKGMSVSQVDSFLKNYNISIITKHNGDSDIDHKCDTCIVTDQKPIAGSSVDINKLRQVELMVQSNS